MILYTVSHGQTCQWPNDYPLPGLDPSLSDCNLPAAFMLEDHGDTALVCFGHASAESEGWIPVGCTMLLDNEIPCGKPVTVVLDDHSAFCSDCAKWGM